MNAESQSVGDFNNGIASLRNWPSITHSFAGEIADAVSSDLTSVYKNKVSSYTRTLLPTKNGPIFLFDQVKSPDEHSYNWLFHAEHTNGKSSIAYADKRMTITRNAARLTMDVISPEIVSNRIRNSDRDESFIALSSAKTKDANFLAVMTPEAKPATGDFPERAKATSVNEKGWLGASVKDNNTTHYGFFRTENNAANTVGGFTTDASKFTAAIMDNKLIEGYFEGSALNGYGISLKANTPVSAAFATSSGGTNVEVKATAAGQLSVSYAGKPSQVLVNGAAAKNWKSDSKSGTVMFNFPAGTSKISIK
jgi:hypothetical protein